MNRAEGGSKAHKNRAGMAQKEILECAQISRSFTDWFQRSFVDSHIGCTCGNYTKDNMNLIWDGPIRQSSLTDISSVAIVCRIYCAWD